MKILTDFHHASLLQSLVLLFEKRLGHELYRPIGMDWYTDGYWNVYPHPDTAKQYLLPGSVPVDGTPPLNDDLSRCITLEEFKKQKFDIIIASIPEHIEPFKKLIAFYQPQAKLIFQIGNAWNIPNNSVRNVMASAVVTPPTQVNYVQYHQEFDTNIFRYEPIKNNRKIYSFINCLGTADLYRSDWALFLQLEKLMPDWEFKSFGGQCRDGWVLDGEELASKMREATFIFHCKTNGDGYGHIIHNAAAVGRPLITRHSDYKGKLAEPLIEDGVSTINVDNRTIEKIKESIEFIAGAPLGFKMGDSIRQKFEENVNFDKEEQEIRAFLQNLL